LVACGSLSLFQGIPGKQNYAASKAGIGAVIRCMATEFGPLGIRANVVAPGLIMTPMMGDEKMQEAIAGHVAPTVPMKRVGRIEDFEGIGAFLCSDASSFMTGETITIDGGYMVRP
jgi:NAD(P)-dependent dehydrogenase (short-subunit alcohol dehydrogenase family)